MLHTRAWTEKIAVVCTGGRGVAGRYIHQLAFEKSEVHCITRPLLTLPISTPADMASITFPKVLLGVMFFMYCRGQVTAQKEKTYFINLDAAPTERWMEVGKDNPQMGPIIKNLSAWVAFSVFFLVNQYTENASFHSYDANVVVTGGSGDCRKSWWRHQMDTFSALRALCQWWILFTQASGGELWCFLWSAPEQTV